MEFPDINWGDLLTGIRLPQGLKVRQKFPRPTEADVEASVRREFEREPFKSYLLPGGKMGPGKRVAITAGSRGIASIARITAAIVDVLKQAGASPFIIPAMGSHGGATAEGQVKVLEEYGITESSVKAPIVSSMETVEVGKLSTGSPIYFSKDALLADAIVVVNRVKAHTTIRGPIESGLQKMLIVGLGKHKGATAVHLEGFRDMPARIQEAAAIVLKVAPVVMGIAIVENAYDEVARIEAVDAPDIPRRDQELLTEAKSLMGKILFDELDVLVVDEIGKNISGTGMDPNVTGRYAYSWLTGGPMVNKLVVLRLTPESHGNATGIGLADITCKGLIKDLDIYPTYINCITSTNLISPKIPVVMPTEKDAVALAIKTCNVQDQEMVKLVRIKNTLELRTIWISRALWEACKDRGDIEPLGEVGPMAADASGRLLDF